MDAINFYKTNTLERVEKVCQEAGTTIGYFRVCMHDSPKNNNRFSPKLATKLEVASNGEMTREELRPDIFGDIAA